MRQKQRDTNLRKYTEENSINLIEIDGRKYKKDKIKDYLTSCFSNILSSP